MTAVKNVLTARWFVTLIGALILCAIVWFVGPLIAVAKVRPLAPAWARLLVVVAILVVWGLVNLFHVLRARKRADALESGIGGDGEAGNQSQAAQEELGVLEQRLNDAVELLRKSGDRRAKKSRYLYEFPWYMIIGPPGSGKTTALVNSGLRFPLGEDRQASVRGVGGTRNCDWWFADEAILLDTAGRYTTQDSDPGADRTAWTGFLRLLRRTRPRQPINGAFVAISLGDLVTQDERERDAHARAIRSRLRELQGELGVRFPVYVLFTKADLISGFTDFFDDLGREERAQVWGTTFPYDDGRSPDGAVGQFDPEFDTLIQRLADRALERIHTETDRDRRGAIFGFPTQFAALKPTLSRFLDEIFRPSQLERRFLLRGVYFTSGTQEGRPVDRVMSAMSGALGLSAPRAGAGRGGRAYFIHDVLRRVAFGEAGVVSVNPAAERREKAIRYGAAAAAVVALIAAGSAWFVSYRGNQMLIDEMQTQVAAYDTEATDLTAQKLNEPRIERVLPALNILRRLPKGYAAGNGAHLANTFGLYQGDKLGAQAESAYRRGLEELFLPVLIARLEEQIARNMDKRRYLFEALKVYLMLGGEGPLEDEMVRKWMQLDWRNRFPGSGNSTRKDLQGHLDALLAKASLSYPLDGALIREARTSLRQQPLAERAYSMIRNSQNARGLTDWRLTEEVGRAASQIFRRTGQRPLDAPVPGLYTKSGFYDVFLPAVADVVKKVNEESWVLGEDNVDVAGKDRLRRKLLAAYYRDYEDAWRRQLGDLAFKQARDIDAIVDLVNDLASPTSPAVTLLERVVFETRLTQPPQTSAAGAADTAAKVAEETRTRSSSRLARVVGEELSDMAQRPGKPVDEAFEPLHRFVNGGGLDGYVDDMKRLRRRLEGVAARGEPLDPDTLRVEASLPSPVDTWMRGLSRGVRSVAVDTARRDFAQAWNGDVLQACQDVVRGRYPFDADSDRAAPLDDFARLFGRDGLLESFFDEQMAEMVDTSSARWRWRSGRPTQLGLPRTMPEQFRRAQAIQKAFFGAGGDRPRVVFTMKPLRLDPDAEQVRLKIHGTEITYSHGPPRPRELRWPGSGNTRRARLTFTPSPDDHPGGLTLTGPWAWFRLLDRAQVERTSSADVIEATFRLGARSARYSIRTDSVKNPFTLEALSAFECPEQL